ncbi:MAG TPA: hypothetical protein VGR47_11115 [Terracidiphilus sp.]|nr:hypothetical protein [Terracidiphilus sp.]
MKIMKASFPAVSLAILIVQLGLASSVAAKYLYERWKCPRVWTRASGYDPELAMRGRYLSLQLTVDGCQSTLPSAAQAAFPRDASGAVKLGRYSIGTQPITFCANVSVKDNTLRAMRITGDETGTEGMAVSAVPGAQCNAMRLDDPVDFYISEHAQDPLPLKKGQELWIEVTVPPAGPPRPIQLALKQDGGWKPLAFE